MKKFSFALFLFCISLAAQSQEYTTPCSFFKEGSFSYRDSATGHLWEFKRNGREQKELNKTTGVSVRYRIEWLSGCIYKLTQQYSNSKEWRKRNRSSWTYVMVSTAERSYTYRCQCSDNTHIGGVVVKIW